MAKVKRTERGWAGHYIEADACLFKRNTLLEAGDRKIVVSTVGAKVYNGEFERIGAYHYYETMAFDAHLYGIYWDANVNSRVFFYSPCTISEIEYASDKMANDMHEAVVDELTLYLEGE